MIKIKALLIATVAFLSLAACSSGSNTDYAQYFRVVRQTVKQSVGGTRVTKAQAAAIPYASMGYRLDNGPEQLIVLATDIDGERLWTSAAHIVIVTHDGRIIRTVGLPHDVAAVTPQKGRQIPPPIAATKAPFLRFADFPDQKIYGAPINCSASPKGAQTILILGRGVGTQRVDEVCRDTALNWAFTDSYWLDRETGMAWRSIQHLGPTGETIETEILRPPA